jgi:hypothetical protein
MSNLHHSAAPWASQMALHEVRTLAAQPQPRWLRVEDGCLWATRRDSSGQREDDVWLVPGDSLALPANSEWVLEAWPQAQFSLLQRAPVKPAGRGWAAWLRPWWQAASWA